MLNSTFRHPVLRARGTRGFTLVELLVVIGIIAILAGVALGPITNGLKKAKESAAMQTCRSLALAEFQYANDNSNYPDGADSGAVAQALVSGGYISDPTIFRIAGGQAKAPAGGAGVVIVSNVDYDFMGCQGASAAVGVPTSAPDTLPLVWSPEPGVSTPPTGTTGVAFKPTTGLFGTDGIAVAYKSNNSFFRTPQSSANTATFPGVGKIMFADQFADLTPPTGDTYAIRLGAEGY